jgi:starch-binding outer membrane protein, SusD/RagB family
MAVLSLTSCNDWLTAETPGTTKLSEAFTNVDVAVNTANAVYVPLMWEYGNSTTYYSEWFIGDIVSDDALKGGQYLQDMAAVRDMENFKTNTNNVFLLGFYRAQWQGISRANLAIEEIPGTKVEESEESTLDRLVGEAKFLRAYYYFRLVRVFGGMPLIDYVVDSSDKWHQERSTQDETYQFIIKDLEDAEAVLPLKSEYSSDDLGRATKGATQAMLMKANLYRAGFLAQTGKTEEAQKCYKAAAEWGKKVIDSNEYSLDSEYFTNFLLKGENDNESVFEIQYVEDGQSDYGEGEGFTRGTFTLILQRSRSKHFGQAGWGFNKPTENLYNEYEPGDLRRDETIWRPADGDMDTPAQEIYLGDSLCNRKYAMYTDGTNGGCYQLTHDSRGPLNNKQIRYSDVLLMYAEACCETGDLASAKAALNKVRNRVGLADFPYSAKIQGKNVSYSDNQDDLRKAIRHERRVELAMEGHRWFDLCRWGIAKETMDAYLQGETAEAQAESATFEKGKHELFPIPSQEIDITGIAQNPKY